MAASSPLGDSYVGRKFFVGILIILVFFVAAYLVRAAAYGRVFTVALILAGSGVVSWALLARDRWWLLMPVAVSFGGFFYFGFRIMFHEAGLLFCFLPLALSLAVDHRRMRTDRPPPPCSIFVLLAYLVFHCMVSLYLAKVNGTGGFGSILRVYMRGLWPLAFLIAFVLYGRTGLIRVALALMYLASLLRIVLGVLAIVFPKMLYVPGINFILPAQTTGGTDLRQSALLFLSYSLCYYAISRRPVWRALHVVGSAVAMALILFGAGRIGLGLGILTVFVFLVVNKQKTLLAVGAAGFLLIAGALNVHPDVLYETPDPVRRTLSVLVLRSPYHGLHKEVALSNEWHFQLARKAHYRWLESPLSFFFGRRVMPFSEDYTALSASFHSRLQIAAEMGTYESGLWTILAVTGAVGALLFLWVFRDLLRGIPRALWRDGICDYAHAFYFLAFLNIISWVLVCWIAGHFPGTEFMLAGIASAVLYDQRHALAPDASSEAALSANVPAPTAEMSG